jgi:hypothetical protein
MKMIISCLINQDLAFNALMILNAKGYDKIFKKRKIKK